MHFLIILFENVYNNIVDLGFISLMNQQGRF